MKVTINLEFDPDAYGEMDGLAWEVTNALYVASEDLGRSVSRRKNDSIDIYDSNAVKVGRAHISFGEKENAP